MASLPVSAKIGCAAVARCASSASEAEVLAMRLDEIIRFAEIMSLNNAMNGHDGGLNDFEQSVNSARREYKKRRSRDEKFQSFELFADPAWDILLDLFINFFDGKKVDTSSACIASCVPVTTALRWLTALEKAGLIEKAHDNRDKRRVLVQISALGVKNMIAYFQDNP